MPKANLLTRELYRQIKSMNRDAMEKTINAKGRPLRALWNEKDRRERCRTRIDLLHIGV